MEQKERPIWMTADSVEAILAGRKTQTRRLVKPQPIHHAVPWPDGSWQWNGGPALRQAGYGADYVHTGLQIVLDIMPKFCPYGTAGDRLWPRRKRDLSVAWKKVDSFLRLEIESVRVERLQDISGRDAFAEGVIERFDSRYSDVTTIHRFRTLWDKINGKKYPWSANVWVWVIAFRRID